MTTTTTKRQCPHCHGSLERYEDPKAVKIIDDLSTRLAECMEGLTLAIDQLDRDYEQTPLDGRAALLRKLRATHAAMRLDL